MTLAELQAKYEGVLLSAPLLAAAIVDLIQDERADEREQCAQLAYAAGATIVGWHIRNRNTEES